MIQLVPLISEGHILTRPILQAWSDHVFLVDEYLYKGYADGILAGCELTTTEDTIVLNEGLMFFENQVFLFKEPMMVKYEPTNTTMVLKVCFSNEMRDASYRYREVDLVLSEQLTLQKGELELCRFKLQEGARLRYLYQDFEDRNTEYDTLNTIHTPYTAKGRSTLSPDITRGFAREMLEQEHICDFDALFCLQILAADKPITKDALVSYIERREKKKLEDTSNLGVYRELLKVLQREKGILKQEEVQKKKQWKIKVD